jgi:hypothetical protein
MAVVLAGVLALATFAIDPFPEELAPSVPNTEEPVAEPEPEPEPLTPRQYLYATYPSLARRMDCVINRESKWDPGAVNRRSGASGLAQFLLSTWYTTPQGKAGASRFDPYANIDGAAWLARNVGWRQWQVVTLGYC